MKRTLALIEQIIEEHKTFLERLETLYQVANDAEALSGFEQTREAFMPGRLDQKEGLSKLEGLINIIDQGLRAHFDREETAVLAAFEEQKDSELTSDFQSLLLEHKDLRNRLEHTKKSVSQLTSGGLSRHLWQATAHDMRAHISHTQKLLAAHAGFEQELLQALRKQLSGEDTQGARTTREH